MDENYNYLQTITGIVYEKLKENPEDEYSRELLESLGNLEKNVIHRRDTRCILWIY